MIRQTTEIGGGVVRRGEMKLFVSILQCFFCNKGLCAPPSFISLSYSYLLLHMQ